MLHPDWSPPFLCAAWVCVSALWVLTGEQPFGHPGRSFFQWAATGPHPHVGILARHDHCRITSTPRGLPSVLVTRATHPSKYTCHAVFQGMT